MEIKQSQSELTKEELKDLERERIDALMQQPLWWGYLHINGKVQVKRFFDNRDLHEAHESPFVMAVCTPMPCENHEDALSKFGVKFGLLHERVEKKEEVTE